MEPIALNLFDYHLPTQLIAQQPADRRDGSRLLHLERDQQQLSHYQFDQIGQLLRPGDVLVLNETKVIPARMVAKTEHGGHIELLLHRPEQGATMEQGTAWWAMGKPGKALRPGKRILLEPMQLAVDVVAQQDGQVLLQTNQPWWPLLQQYGAIPLPPYIRRTEGEQVAKLDQERYQTVFANVAGSVAAPTASLHFTETLLAALQQQGVLLQYLWLHVGLGTFLPIRSEHEHDVRQHQMLAERYEIPEVTCQTLAQAKQAGQRILAVGTTVVRALESYGQSGQRQGEATLLITPGHRFAWIDGLVTNFHLPRSTLLLLVAALVGREVMLQAYQTAIDKQYRFFSYGDGMLIT